MLGRYAALQLKLADYVDALPADVSDLTLATLPDKYARLVGTIEIGKRYRTAMPQVAELRDQLAAYGIAGTIQHDDLHNGQVIVRDGRHLLMDWGTPASFIRSSRCRQPLDGELGL